MRPTISILALAAVLALGLPGSALAGPALDQYIETLPSAGGDKPSQNGGGGSGGGPGGSLTVSGSELEALQASGEDGAAAAAAVAATAPRVRGGANENGNARAKGDRSPFLVDEDGDAAIPAVLSTVAGGGSGGVALPIVLLAVLLVGLALAARGRRASTGR